MRSRRLASAASFRAQASEKYFYGRPPSGLEWTPCVACTAGTRNRMSSILNGLRDVIAAFDRLRVLYVIGGSMPGSAAA